MKTAWRQIRLCIFGDNVAFVVLTWVCSTVLPHFMYFLEFHFWHDTIWNMTSCRRDEMTWLDDMHERAYFDLDWFDIVDDMTVLSWSSFFNRCSLCLLYCCWFSRHLFWNCCCDFCHALDGSFGSWKDICFVHFRSCDFLFWILIWMLCRFCDVSKSKCRIAWCRWYCCKGDSILWWCFCLGRYEKSLCLTLVWKSLFFVPML